MNFIAIMKKRQYLHSVFLESCYIRTIIYPLDAKILYLIYSKYNSEYCDKYIFKKCTYKNRKCQINFIRTDGVLFLRDVCTGESLEIPYDDKDLEVTF